MKMPIKQLVVFLLTFTLGFSFIYYKGLEVQKHKKRTPLSQASIQSSMAITIPYLFFPNTSADANQVNSDFGTVVNDGVNTIINDIASLFTDATQKGNNETITGKWIFSSGITSNLNNDNDVILDSDNTGSESNRLCYSVNRGSTSANDPAICWINGVAKVVTDRTSLTLDKLQVTNGASGNDVVTWQQVVKNTGNETIGGDKSATGIWTYSNPITQNAPATSINHLMRKGEVEAADSAITAGGCSVGVGAPLSTCTHGACYWDETDINNPIHYFCNSSMSWVKQDLDNIDLMLTINGATTINGNVTQAANFIVSGTRTLDAGNNRWINASDPINPQDLATKNYSDSKTSPIYGDGSDGTTNGICNITSNTTLTRDIYCTTFTVSNGAVLNPGGYKVFSTGDCNIQAGSYIKRNGNDGTNAGGGNPGSGGGALQAGSIPGGLAGTDGGQGGNGNSPCNSDLRAGMTGTNATTLGGQGTAGTSVSIGNCSAGTNTVSSNLLRDFFSATIWKDWASGTLASVYSYTGNCGGGGGASDCSSPSCGGGGGGGSGSQGGNAFLACKNLILNGTVQLKGGKGGDGGSCVCSMSYPGAGAPPGDGGIATLIYNTKSGTGTIDVSAGTPGMSGPACGGSPNNDGPAGMTGFVIEIMGA